MLKERLEGLSAALENASVEKSKQSNLLSSMKKELKETQDFISVSISAEVTLTNALSVIVKCV